MRVPRQRYLRAFVEWLAEQGDALPVRLCRVQNRKRCLVYRIAGYPPELELVVRPGEVQVVVTYGGQCWDILVCFESAAVRVEGGYRCGLCLNEEARWASRQELWRSHDFDALAGWLRSRLVTAKRLDLHQTQGMTWAALSTSLEPPVAASLKISWLLPISHYVDPQPSSSESEFVVREAPI